MNVAGSGASGAFEFLADDAGEWMFHCHMHKGMARVASDR